MRKSISVVIGMALLASPAFAQVRPQDCRPVLPVVDQAAMAVPQDVIAQPAAPAVAASRRFLGLPLLIPALAALGGVAIAASDDDDGGSDTPVSPA